MLSYPTFRAEVTKDCTAIQAFIIFVGALFLLAPIRFRRKLIIAAASGIIIYAVNIFRIALELYLAVTTTIAWDIIHGGAGLVLGSSTVVLLVILAVRYSQRSRTGVWSSQRDW